MQTLQTSQKPQNTKITPLEISILILGNLLLLLFIYITIAAITSAGQYITARGLIALLIYMGSPIVIVPWFLLSLINLIKHRNDYRTRAIVLLVVPSLTALLTLLIIMSLDTNALSILFPLIKYPFVTVILVSISIIITDIIFFLLYRSQQKRQLPKTNNPNSLP